MSYDAQLIAEGKCPELVWVDTEDGRVDGRCLAPVVPTRDGEPGFACAKHSPAIEDYLAKPLEQRWAEDAEAERWGGEGW